MRKRFLIAQHLEEAVFPLCCNPQLVLLPCEVATMADGEVVAVCTENPIRVYRMIESAKLAR